MTISEFVQTTSAISAIIMIQIGAFWLKQFTRDAVRSR
jgi:hypothetical protein